MVHKNSKLLPEISSSTKNDDSILDINVEFIDFIYEIVNNCSDKAFILKSVYYKGFFNNESTLFMLFYKIYHTIINFDKSNDDVDFLLISDNEKNNSNENLFFKTNKNTFFQQLRSFYTKYNNEISQEALVFLISVCSHQYFNNFNHFVNLKTIFPENYNSKENPIISNKTHAKNLLLFHSFYIGEYKTIKYDIFNCFYTLNSKTFNNQNELMMQVKRFIIEKNTKNNKPLICIINCEKEEFSTNALELFKKLNLENYFYKIIFVNNFHTSKIPKEIKKINFDFNLRKLENKSTNTFLFNNSSKKSISLLKLLSNIWNLIQHHCKENISYSSISLFKKIRQDIILNDFGFYGDNMAFICITDFLFLLKEIKNTNFYDEILMEIVNEFNNKYENENYQDWLNYCVDIIKQYKYDYIYIYISDKFIAKSFIEQIIDLFKEKIGMDISIVNGHNNEFNKLYNNNKILFINFGQDKKNIYYLNKIDSLYIVGPSSFHYIKKMTTNNNFSSLFVNKGSESKEKLLTTQEENVYKIFNLKYQNVKKYINNIQVINKNTNKNYTYSSTKKILYTLDGISYSFSSLEDLFHSDIKTFKTFCFENSHEVFEIWKKVKVLILEDHRHKREAIKLLATKNKYIKNKHINKKDYYKKIADDILIAYKKKNNSVHKDINIINDINIKSWIEHDTLPSKKEIFECLLDFLCYEGDKSLIWKIIQNENQKSRHMGKENKVDMNNFLEHGFDNKYENDAFYLFIKEIHHLQKTYTIEETYE